MCKMIRSLALISCFLLLAGCSSNLDAEVTGKVTFNKKALPSGTITFVGADGKKAYSAISPTGVYSVRGLGRGTAKISVQSHSRVPKGLNIDLKTGKKPAPNQTTVIEIPKHYSDPETSNLSVEINSSKVEHPVELTEK